MPALIAMLFTQYWHAMTVRNSKLANENATVEIKVIQFKKLLAQAFAEGLKSASEPTPSSQPGKSPITASMEDVFSGIFGNKK